MNMEITKLQIKMLSCCFVAGGLMLAGCSTDDSIDVGEVDTTIGVKLDNFSVPLGNTEDITLGDVLDLKEDGCISTTASGDYEFFKKGDNVEPARPQVDKINVSKQTSTDMNPVIGPSTKPDGFDLLPVGTTLTGTAGAITTELNTFNYNADKPDDVVELSTATVDGTVHLNISFNKNLKAFISKFNSFDIEFPAYMTLENPTQGTLVGNKLSFGEVPTNSTINCTVKMKSLAFQELNAANKLVIEGGKITMLGDVKVEVTYPDLVKTDNTSDITKMQILSTTSISTVQITSATGKFDPKIDLDDVGDIKIDKKDVPDFLDDPEVNINLYDPQITLTIGSDVDLDAIIDGTLTSTFNNGTSSVVSIPNILIPRKTNSKILICRQPKTQPYEDYTQVYVVSNLSDLITKIPEKITFKANARADKNAPGTIELGHKYEISTGYSFKAPLSLDNGSTIVYDDKVDGFYEDINDNDVALDGKSELTITGKVTNKTPLNLDLTPTAIDVKGNVISSIKLTSKKAIASNLNGGSPTNIEIVLEKAANVDLKQVKFDGITFKVKATSADATTLNKTKHTLKIEGLKVQINSEISINPDKKD